MDIFDIVCYRCKIVQSIFYRQRQVYPGLLQSALKHRFVCLLIVMSNQLKKSYHMEHIIYYLSVEFELPYCIVLSFLFCRMFGCTIESSSWQPRQKQLENRKDPSNKDAMGSPVRSMKQLLFQWVDPTACNKWHHCIRPSLLMIKYKSNKRPLLSSWPWLRRQLREP